MRNIKLLTWINFLNSFQLFSAIAILYFVHVTGSYALGLSIFSISSLTTAVFDVPLGILSDRSSRKRIILIGLFASLIQIVLYAGANTFTSLALGAFFGGLSYALFSGNNSAFLHDTLSELDQIDEFPKALGRVSSTNQLGLGLATLLGAIITSNSLRLAVQLSIFPIVGGIVVACFLYEPKVHDRISKQHYLLDLKEAIRLFVQNARLRWLTIGSVTESSLGESSHQFQASFYATIMPIWAIGIVKTTTYLAGFLSFYFSGEVIERFSEFPSLIFSSIFTRLTNIFAYLFPSLLSPVLITANSLTYGVGSVAKGSLFQQEFSPKQRATMGSLNSLAENIAFAIFGPLLGMIADHFTPSKAMLLFQILMISSIFIFVKLFKKDQARTSIEDAEPLETPMG